MQYFANLLHRYCVILCENDGHCFFFDVRGIVHREFVPPGQIVNQKFYLEVLRRLRENVRRKRQELWRSGVILCVIFTQCAIHNLGERNVVQYTKGPPPQKKIGFSLKKIYLHFEQKTLNPLQNTLHWRQYTCLIFFPTV